VVYQAETEVGLAYVGPRTAHALRKLRELESVTLLFYGSLQELKAMATAEAASKKSALTASIKINISGSRERTEAVNSFLTECELHLQEPFYLETCNEYDNPQLVSFPELRDIDVQLEELRLDAAAGSEAVGFARVLDSLPQHHRSILAIEEPQVAIDLMEFV